MISGLSGDDLIWRSQDVENIAVSDTITDFVVGESKLDLTDLVKDKNEQILDADQVDIFDRDGSLVLRVDTDGDHTWNQEIILQNVTLDDITDENGVIKNGILEDENVKQLFENAVSTDIVNNTHIPLEDPLQDFP